VYELWDKLPDAGQLGIGPVVDRTVQDSLKDFRAGQPKLEMLTQYVWMEPQKVLQILATYYVFSADGR